MSTATHARRTWINVAALAVVLPIALLVRGRDALPLWWHRIHTAPAEVARGTAQPYAGARWKLTELARLPGERADMVVMVAAFEALVDDLAALKETTPCQVALTDRTGRLWKPVVFAGSAVRKAMPAIMARPACGTFDKAAQGQTVQMVASFFVPTDAKDLSLSVTMMRALPERLLLR